MRRRRASLGEEPATPKRGRKACSCLSADPKWKWLRMDLCTTYSATPYGNAGRVLDPAAIVQLLREHVPDMLNDAQENIVVVPLNTRGQAVGVARVHRGGRGTSMVEISSVFQPVVAAAPATRFVIVHNHPTGNLAPSPEDASLADRLRGAANIMGLPMLDFIIVGPEPGYYSFVEAGRFRQ